MRRNSISFSATEKVRAKNKSRRTEFSLSKNNDADEPRDPNATLFETLMNDPVKRAMVLELINSEKEAIEEYKRQERLKQMQAGCSSPADKLKRKYVLESPTAFLRRKALQSAESSGSCSDRTTPSPTPAPTQVVPFNQILEKVVAFVEVKSKNEDRSDGVKALLRNMGATVVEQFTKNVTHVIYKDGSFLTYQKAKLMKKHLVSVLWLEMMRTTGRRVPERNYPALGTSGFDNNVTIICEKLQNEYMDVVKDEMRKAAVNDDPLSQKTFSSQQNKMALLSKLGSMARSSPSPSSFHSFSDDLIPSTQDLEVKSITSGSSRLLPRGKTPDSLVLGESDAESDCGVVNGYSFKKADGDQSRKLAMILSDDSEKLCDSSGSSKPTEPDKTVMEKLVDTDKKAIITPKKSRKSVKVNSGLRKSKKKVNSNTPTSSSSVDKCTENVNPTKTVAPSIVINDAEKSVNPPDEECAKSSECISATKKKRRTLYSINDHKHLLNISDEKPISIKTRRAMKNEEYFHNTTEGEKTKRNTRRSLYNPTKLQSNDDKKRHTMHPKQLVQSANNSSSKISEESLASNDSLMAKEGDVSLENVEVPSLENKRKQSLESVSTNVSEELGMFVTRRKPRNTQTNLDKDGFKIPDKANNSSLLTDHATQIEDSSTEKIEKVSKLSMTSTEGQLSSLRISEGTSKKSMTSVEMSPLMLSKTDSTSQSNAASRKSSFSPLENITNSNSISNLISHLDSSNGSSELNEPRRVTRGRKSRLLKENETNSPANILGENVLKRHIQPGDEEGSPVKRMSSCDETSSPDKENFAGNGRKEKAPSSDESGKRRGRKLYNPNDSYSDSLQQQLIDEVEKEELAKKTFKKPNNLPLTPIILTVRSKTFIEKKLASVSSSNSDDGEEVIRDILTSVKTPVKKKKVKEVKIDASLDEQKDLIKEFVAKKPTRSQKTPDDSLPIKPQLNRRSTMDFMPRQTPTPKKNAKGKSRRPSIVCTRFHRNDVLVFQQIVRKLGSFVVENDVTDRTTHLIVAEPSRTINILRAIARGIWVLRSEWLYSSLENGKWLPEEDYELTDFSPAVQQCRIERQTFGPLYSMDLFENCGAIYVARSTNPRYTDLEELIVLAKGRIVNTGRNADVCVGETLRYENIICVGATWVLDSIMFNTCKNYDNYILQVPTPRK